MSSQKMNHIIHKFKFMRINIDFGGMVEIWNSFALDQRFWFESVK